MNLKPVHEMTNAELLEEAKRRDERRRLNLPLSESALRPALASEPTPSEQAAVDAPDEEALEDAHYVQGDKLVRALGGEVVSFVQKRRAKVTPGIPDRKYYWRRLRLTAWWEAKATWGQQRPAQRAFQEMAEACDEVYVLGTYDDFVAWLLGTGHFIREGDHVVPLRRAS